MEKKEKTFNIICLVVTAAVILLFLEVMREQFIMKVTGWLGISAFLLNMWFIPVIVGQLLYMFSNRIKNRVIWVEILLWAAASAYYFYGIR